MKKKRGITMLISGVVVVIGVLAVLLIFGANRKVSWPSDLPNTKIAWMDDDDIEIEEEVDHYSITAHSGGYVIAISYTEELVREGFVQEFSYIPNHGVDGVAWRGNRGEEHVEVYNSGMGYAEILIYYYPNGK